MYEEQRGKILGLVFILITDLKNGDQSSAIHRQAEQKGRPGDETASDSLQWCISSRLRK